MSAMNALADWFARKWKGERNAAEYAASDAPAPVTTAGAIVAPGEMTERHAERAPRRKRAPREAPRPISDWLSRRRDKISSAPTGAETMTLTDLEPVQLAAGRYMFAAEGEFPRGSVCCLQAELPGSKRWAVVPNASGAGLAQLLAPGFALVDLPCGRIRIFAANGCVVQATIAPIPTPGQR